MEILMEMLMELLMMFLTCCGMLRIMVPAGQRCSAMLRARLVKVKKEKVEQEQYVSEAIECEVCRPPPIV